MRSARSSLTLLTAVGLLAAAGCSAGSPLNGQTSTTRATAAKTTVFQVTINGKSVTPSPANVDLPLGTTFRLVVTSDHDDEVHAHGFDKEVTIKAGVPTTLNLTATTPGVYEIETHHPPLTLLHLVVH